MVIIGSFHEHATMTVLVRIIVPVRVLLFMAIVMIIAVAMVILTFAE
jgi:hypothetical protein